MFSLQVFLKLYLVLEKYQGNKKNIKENSFLMFGFMVENMKKKKSNIIKII